MSNPKVQTPKIVRKFITRSVILMVTMGVLFYGYQWAQQQKGDFDFAPADSAGYVGAIRFEDEGQRAVAFSPEGKLVENPGFEPGVIDRDLTWQPDGNRIFFVSDRSKLPGSDVRAFNIFRWNPVSNDAPVQRTDGTRGRSNPAFSDEPAEDRNASALIVSGGFVLEFTSKDRATRQVLPPLGREVSVGNEEGGGSSGQFGQAYEKFGSSFRIAKWCMGKKFIAAIMRNDSGEVLVIQDLESTDRGLKPPIAVAGGERIEIAISPKDGKVVYCVQGFRWPDEKQIPEQFRKGNRITFPFKHGIAIFDPANPTESAPVALSSTDDLAFGTPTISPDGSVIAVTVGSFVDGAVATKQLAVMPLRAGGGQAPAILSEGEVFEPDWSPDGSKLVFVKRESGKRKIFTITKDGSDETALSTEGDFGSPKFSPQSR